MDEQKVRELIAIFLELNCKPADEQVHALAGALGMDHETLEAVIYEMLGEVVDDVDTLSDPEEIDAADEEVLNDPDLDPDNMPLDDLAMNDGDVTDDDLGFQQETNDDGPDVHDIGVGISSTDSSDVLTDDGVPLPPEV